MSAIEQIVIMHNGSAEKERAERAAASVRAGSAAPAKLQDFCRQVERYAYYALPADTPGEDMPRATAATSPPRMIFVPGRGGADICGLISYRPTANEVGEGAFFAHILLPDEPRAETAWSALDCLRLWDAPGWLREDAASLPAGLPRLSGLHELTRGDAPAVDESVLLSFLTAPSGGTFTDPHGVIAPRWRRMAPAMRQTALRRALGGLLAAASHQRGAAILAAEPGMAALLFFGVLRLLPAALRRQISFSTFEPNPERIVTTLAATWFHKPEVAEASTDALRGRGAVVSTFERHLAGKGEDSAYARLVVEKLLQGGMAAVDALLQAIPSTGASALADLELFAEAESAVAALLTPGGAASSDRWRQSPATVAYLRKRLIQEVASTGDVRGTLLALVGSPQHVVLCELFASQAAACDFLLAALPEDRAAEALAAQAIPAEAKASLLTRLLTENGRLPPGCDAMLGSAGDGAGLFDPLMPHALCRVPPDQVDRLRESLSPQGACGLAAALAAACASDPAAGEALSRAMRGVSAADVLSLFEMLGPEFFEKYPQDEPLMHARLAETLAALPEEPASFSKRLNLLAAAERLLASEEQREAVTAWVRARRAMIEIGSLQKKGGWFARAEAERLEAACRTMAESVHFAWPANEQDGAPGVAGRVQRLSDLGCSLLGGPFLPRDSRRNQILWRKIALALEQGSWPSNGLARRSALGGKGSQPPLAAVAVIAVSLVAICVALYYLNPWQSSPPVAATTAQNTAASPRDPQPPASNAPQEPSRPVKQNDTPEAMTPPSSAGGSAKADQTAKQPADASAVPPGGATPEATKDAPDGPDAAPSAKADPAVADDPQWLAAARRFAAAHRGCVVEGVELDQGAYLLPVGALEVADPPSKLSLGAGWIKFDGQLYKFGSDFEQQQPTASHQLPEFAKKLGFASFTLSIEARDSGVWILGRGEQQQVDQTAVARVKDQIDKLKTRQNRLMGRKTEWDKLMLRPDSEEKESRAAAMRAALIDEAELSVPPQPEPPDRSDERFAKENDADGSLFREAQREYERLSEERRQALLSVPEAAWKAIKTMGDEIKTLDAKITQLNAETRLGNDQAARVWKAARPTLAAIIYQSTVKAADPAEATGLGAPRPETPQGETFAPIPGAFKVDAGKGGYRPENPYIAKLRFQIVGGQPKWVHDGAVVNVAIREHTDEGEVRNAQVIEITKTKEHLVLAGTKRVELRYEFIPNHRVGEAGAAGATDWQAIEPVLSGDVWTVKFEPEKNAFDPMRPKGDGKGR